MNTESKHTDDSTETFVRSLVDLGTEWAVLGISFGKEALERSARSLELAAKTLSTVSAGLEKKRAHVDAPPSTDSHEDDGPKAA